MAGQKKAVHRNVVVVVGVVARDPEVRELADGSTVVELDVKVSVEGGGSSTVPVTSIDDASGAIVAGAEVVVLGRVRRRFYRAGGATVSRTDVLAEAVVPVTPVRRASALLAEAAARLAS